ncbi:TetR/AcrR family transcriptional regulator [Streptacidiphilus sp. P02-A3a]|uniref:TetR/AcrR family transcriptional regulator n=1 Tax=Streptacidiphilus sp. P02-A3a TaxID=2704468 RepID=UPI0015FCE8D8|nr:TetR/AcrR family transcriptional regulator [Streptacidiphilus sp. P02-A3a]QMU72454.1 TetR/AcrR family transcriptional regulator [Streptacidiphilus sp. P02-A3a]
MNAQQASTGAEPHCPRELTLLGQPPRERADAARNRSRLLDAAAQLVRELGAQNVTMDAVAAAAHVGKGTLFRRFGDREGLMRALLDHAEAEYQRGFLTGPPPLGPGAGPGERLLAFGCATIRHHLDHLDLYLAADTCAERRLLVPAAMLRVSHVAGLLRQAGVDGDTDLLAQALNGYLDPVLLHHLHVQRGYPVARLENGWRQFVTRQLPAPE